jgi:hypothetical protein
MYGRYRATSSLPNVRETSRPLTLISVVGKPYQLVAAAQRECANLPGALMQRYHLFQAAQL